MHIDIDFVLEAGRDTLAVEVKAAARFDEADLAGLRAFLRTTPRCRGAILAYNGTSVVKTEDRLWVIPLRRVIS